MAKMVECKPCKSKVAQYARTCPYCGQKNPTINMGVAVLMIISFTVFVAWLLVGWRMAKIRELIDACGKEESDGEPIEM